MEPGLGGPDGDVEDGRRLGQRQVEVEVQDQHDPLVVRQARERLGHDLAIRDGPREVGLADAVAVGLHVQLDHVASP